MRPFSKSTGMFAALVLQRDAPLVVVKCEGQCAANTEKTCPFVFEGVVAGDPLFVVSGNLVE